MANVSSTVSLRSILEKDKLNRTNFLVWFFKLRIVLTQQRKLYVLDRPIPKEPAKDAPKVQKDAYEKHLNDSLEVSCLMLDTMVPELKKDLEMLVPFEMLKRLREMFQQQVRRERFETNKALLSCKMAEGESVSTHILEMKGVHRSPYKARICHYSRACDGFDPKLAV